MERLSGLARASGPDHQNALRPPSGWNCAQVGERLTKATIGSRAKPRLQRPVLTGLQKSVLWSERVGHRAQDQLLERRTRHS